MRGEWGMRWVSGILVTALLVSLAAGCKKRGPSPDEASGLEGPGLVDEEGLGATSPPGSSLTRARQGLPPEEGGVLGDVYFDYDSFELDTEAFRTLERNVRWLRENPRAKVEIEGHCDNRGTIEYNLALGAKRARSVKEYLIEQGIEANRVSTISYGEELPVCTEDTESCWSRNRRAHFVVLGP